MRCAEPGCEGTVVDGYCDVCGSAPAPPSASPGVPPGSTPSTAVTTGRSTSASRATARSTGSTRTGSSRSSSSRGRLGAGVVMVPRVPTGDPAAAILADPKVPEKSRFCGNPDCGKPVGRGTEGTPGRPEGFCTQCGTKYSFVPKLSRGDVVGGQYEVQGAIAHGGLGWIYLAVDRNVHNRWVVLKGLLNSSDADAMAAAAAEVLTLSGVEHPNIVKIYNFVQHMDVGATAPVGYIVMEYVGGTSLKQIRKALGGPLPADQAVAYIVEIAPAIAYLHAQNLAYCDFKPDNVMQTDEQLKLIDLGAVIAMDDEVSAIFGTAGYQAPEIAHTGPTVASDVYTVGRTLAVLVMDVPQEHGRFVDQLPGPDVVPVLAKYDSLYRAILRATDPEAERRFSSMEELADQLTGVLYEIAAIDKGVEQPRMSTYFSPQRAVYGSDADVAVRPDDVIAALPVPVVDPADPGAAVLATTSGTPPAQLEHALYLARGGANQAESSSVEIPLRLVRAALEVGSTRDARNRLAQLNAVVAGDWRLTWYSAQCTLLERDFDRAAAEFEVVLATLPGELAPKLALAATAEFRGASADAMRYYEMVWRTDHSYVSAAFGLARQRVRAGDRVGAIAALDQIPTASAHFTEARTTAIEILFEGRTPASMDEQTLLDADKRAGALTLESASKRATIRLQVLGAALGWLRAGNANRTPRLLGADFDERGIRTGMESCYRELAHDAPGMWERITLVEQANAIRPRTRL